MSAVCAASDRVRLRAICVEPSLPSKALLPRLFGRHPPSHGLISCPALKRYRGNAAENMAPDENPDRFREKLELIIRLTADSLSKARELSKIALDGRPELRNTAAQIMKTVKATHRKIEALNEAAQQNGKLDEAALDQALDRILKAAQEINREVADLVAKARR
jgi:hypothetical protein